MTTRLIVGQRDLPFAGLDLVYPTAPELELAARCYGLDATSLREDCLDPEQLPKSERIGATTLPIARTVDLVAAGGGVPVQELPRKGVARILTLFPVPFLPLTFVVGVSGMNFEFMPEPRARWGHPAPWAVMILVTSIIFPWFRRRGWLRE